MSYLMQLSTGRGKDSVISGLAPIERPEAIEIVHKKSTSLPLPPLPPTALSERELQVMGLLAKGYLVKEIADAQGVSFFTVKAQMRSIYAKLNCNSRSQAIIAWLRRDEPEQCPCCGQVLRAGASKI